MEQIGLRSRLNLPKSNRKLQLASIMVVALGLFVGSQTTKSTAQPKELLEEDKVIGSLKLQIRPENLKITPVNEVFAQ